MSHPRTRRPWSLILATAVAASTLNNVGVAARPLVRRQSDHQQGPVTTRDDDSPSAGSDVSPKVWVPAVVVVLVLLGAFCFVWTRTSVLTRLRGAASRAVRPRPSSPSNTTREVTASQLTGTAAASANRNNGSGNNGGRTNARPGRRTRRTPSQMSTASLPMYMKEPGDQELVIFRGPEAMDASGAIAEAREAEETEEGDGDEESASLHAAGAVDQSALSLGLTNADADGEADPDTSTTALLPLAHQHTTSRDSGVSRDSGDTTDSQSQSLLTRHRSDRTSDVPSDAPPEYDDSPPSTAPLQGRDSTSSAGTGMMNPPGLISPLPTPDARVSFSSPSPSPVPVSPPSSPEPRRSRLASRVSQFLHLRTISGASSVGVGSGLPEGRVSDASNVISLNDAPSPTPQTQGRHHHSLSSTSTLALPLPPVLRTLSRQRTRSSNTLSSSFSLSRSPSHPNLTSPSSLSLSLAAGTTAISSPLSHTLMRTEIRYPAGGPTPDQVRVLSAREGLGKFGVPYGEDAVEYARNNPSRLDLSSGAGGGEGEGEDGPPPPEFESPTGEVGASAARPRASTSASHGDEHGHDEDEGSDPDALPPDTSSPPARNRSGENLAMETRILVPLIF